jgi:hypothetical protein
MISFLVAGEMSLLLIGKSDQEDGDVACQKENTVSEPARGQTRRLAR